MKHYIPKDDDPLERKMQAKVEEYARNAHDCLVRKMNGLGYRDWPDDMFITPKGRVFFLEAKRKGKEPTFLQWAMLNDLATRGVFAAWYDNVEEGISMVDLGVDGGRDGAS
jgi:hypothetical protein